MRSQTLIKLVAYSVSGVYAVILFALGIHLPSIAVKVASSLPLVIVAIFAGFDRWLWRVKPFSFMVLGRPCLKGTWHGTLTALTENNDGTQSARDIHVFLDIRQTFTDLSISLISPESKSRSTTAEIIKNADSDFTVWYQYQNIPGAPVRPKSPIHFGGSRLEVLGHDPKKLTGEYWTDRLTRGKYEVELMTKKHFGSFANSSAYERKAA